MIEKKDILKMAKKVFRQSHSKPDRRIIHPSREWLHGLTLFLIILLLGGMYAANMFVRYQNVDTEDGTATERLPQYQVTNVEAALEIYDARKSKFDSYRGNAVEAFAPELVAEEAAEEEKEIPVPAGSLDVE